MICERMNKKMKTSFSIQAELPIYQHVRLLGNIPYLGNWSPFDSLEMQNTSCSACRTWSVEIPTPVIDKFCYRYLVCESWKEKESNIFSIIKCGPLQESHVKADVNDGTLAFNDPAWFDGWLLHETEVHLAVHNSSAFPIHLLRGSHANHDVFKIKVSAMKIGQGQERSSGGNSFDVVTKIVGDYCAEVFNQQELEITYDSSKHYSFVAPVLDLKDVIFKIELCVANWEDESKAIGHGFIQPVDLKASFGVLNVCISDNAAPMGFIRVEYLVIKPLTERSLHNMGDWCDRNWQKRSRTLDMGHRGCGATFSTSRDGVQENTIESFINAYEKGADGVELDVHATKDLQLVTYHDLNVKTLLQTKNGCKVPLMVPVHQLTYKELQQIQVEHTNSPELNRELQSREDLYQKIFPTLEEVLTSLPVDLPIELEVKYLETEKDKEDDPFLDVNHYVDSILRTVLRNIGKRKIILMSFSPVIVQLFSRKQKKIPVKIGVCGETDKYPVYKDIRIRTVGMAVGFSHSERILGVSCFCEHVLTSPSTVNKIMDKDLILSTWGEDNNQHDVREKQREMAINVLCYDRIHEILQNKRS